MPQILDAWFQKMEEFFLELTCQTCRTFLSVSDEIGFFTAVVSQQVLAKRGALIINGRDKASSCVPTVSAILLLVFTHSGTQFDAVAPERNRYRNEQRLAQF